MFRFMCTMYVYMKSASVIALKNVLLEIFLKKNKIRFFLK